jgi:hypothetical protein
MTKLCINKQFLFSMVVITLVACGSREKHQNVQAHSMDSAVAVEIRAINGQLSSSVKTILPETGNRIFSVQLDGVIAYDQRKQQTISSRVGGRVEKLYIRYNYQPVRRGQMIMRIYSPDLAAAQQELIMLGKSDNAGLMQKAEQRLQLLGMSASEISKVVKTGRVVYSIPVYSNFEGYVAEAGNMAEGKVISNDISVREGQYITAGQSLFNVYGGEDLVAEFSVNPKLSSYIAKGQNVLFYPATNKDAIITGTVGLVEPVIRNGESFGVVRIYMKAGDFKPGQVVRGNVPVVVKGGWWLPAAAVLRKGQRSIVFRKTGDHFQPHEVDVKVSVGEQVNISSDIGDWEVANNAAFLSDSDSFLNTQTD